MTTPKRFKGWDWTELSERFGIDINQEDDAIAEQTRNFLGCALAGPDSGYARNSPESKHQREVAKTIRQYLRVFVKQCPGYDGPIFEALMNVKHDETVIKWTSELLTWMWS